MLTVASLCVWMGHELLDERPSRECESIRARNRHRDVRRVVITHPQAWTVRLQHPLECRGQRRTVVIRLRDEQAIGSAS